MVSEEEPPTRARIPTSTYLTSLCLTSISQLENLASATKEEVGEKLETDSTSTYYTIYYVIFVVAPVRIVFTFFRSLKILQYCHVVGG